jgi:hypothetical protein
VEVVYGPTGPFLWACWPSLMGLPMWAYWPFLEHSGATTNGPTVLEEGFCSGSTLSFSVLEEAKRRRCNGRLNAIRDAQLRSDALNMLFYGANTDV